MDGYFDIHCHLLPGVDDGANDIKETCRMLEKAYDEGIRVITATPHYSAYKHNASPERLRELLNTVNHATAENGRQLKVILGNELLFSMDLIEAIKRGDALTIDGTRYILVEFSFGVAFKEIRDGLNQCIYAGYIPILAHAERYRCLRKEPELVGELINLGCYIQINMSSIQGGIGDSKVAFAHKLMKREWVHFLGTDAHGDKDRAPAARHVVTFLKKKYGEAVVRRLLWDNPMTMLEDRHL